MRKLAIAAIAAVSLAGAGGLALPPFASAQTAPNSPAPPPAAAPAPMPMHGMPMHGGWHGPGHQGWMHEGEMRGPGRHGWIGGKLREALLHRLRTWGLFHHTANLALTPDDVKIIGEAILLRHGQHDWKVGDVTPNADGTVSFAFVTAHGDLIARFVVNTRTGRISRTD